MQCSIECTLCSLHAGVFNYCFSSILQCRVLKQAVAGLNTGSAHTNTTSTGGHAAVSAVLLFAVLQGKYSTLSLVAASASIYGDAHQDKSSTLTNVYVNVPRRLIALDVSDSILKPASVSVRVV